MSKYKKAIATGLLAVVLGTSHAEMNFEHANNEMAMGKIDSQESFDAITEMVVKELARSLQNEAFGASLMETYHDTMPAEGILETVRMPGEIGDSEQQFAQMASEQATESPKASEFLASLGGEEEEGAMSEIFMEQKESLMNLSAVIKQMDKLYVKAKELLPSLTQKGVFTIQPLDTGSESMQSYQEGGAQLFGYFKEHRDGSEELVAYSPEGERHVFKKPEDIKDAQIYTLVPDGKALTGSFVSYLNQLSDNDSASEISAPILALASESETAMSNVHEALKLTDAQCRQSKKGCVYLQYLWIGDDKEWSNAEIVAIALAQNNFDHKQYGYGEVVAVKAMDLSDIIRDANSYTEWMDRGQPFPDKATKIKRPFWTWDDISKNYPGFSKTSWRTTVHFFEIDHGIFGKSVRDDAIGLKRGVSLAYARDAAEQAGETAKRMMDSRLEQMKELKAKWLDLRKSGGSSSAVRAAAQEYLAMYKTVKQKTDEINADLSQNRFSAQKLLQNLATSSKSSIFSSFLNWLDGDDHLGSFDSRHDPLKPGSVVIRSIDDANPQLNRYVPYQSTHKKVREGEGEARYSNIYMWLCDTSKRKCI